MSGAGHEATARGAGRKTATRDSGKGGRAGTGGQRGRARRPTERMGLGSDRGVCAERREDQTPAVGAAGRQDDRRGQRARALVVAVIIVAVIVVVAVVEIVVFDVLRIVGRILRLTRNGRRPRGRRVDLTEMWRSSGGFCYPGSAAADRGETRSPIESPPADRGSSRQEGVPVANRCSDESSRPATRSRRRRRHHRRCRRCRCCRREMARWPAGRLVQEPAARPGAVASE